MSDTHKMENARPQHARSWLHSRWVVPVVSLVLLTALMGAGLFRSREPITVSQLRQEIHEIVLNKKSDAVWEHGGGVIGPWHVAASSLDERTGELRDFRLVSGALNLGAARARLTIDAQTNTFSFELREVVIMSVPTERGDQGVEHHLIPLDSFLLGPAKYHRPIVPD